ncbi:MAG: hypothetical protein E7360_00950 [Clostridiales bacterium]|nr:hypothetical protein [Clostridiales bacterium]
MKEFKVVPCQGRVVAKTGVEASKQISALASIVTQESIGGWELISAMPIVVASSKKRFRGTETPYNALVFAREVIKEEDAKK